MQYRAGASNGGWDEQVCQATFPSHPFFSPILPQMLVQYQDDAFGGADWHVLTLTDTDNNLPGHPAHKHCILQAPAPHFAHCK